jgi:hypothetical protein
MTIECKEKIHYSGVDSVDYYKCCQCSFLVPMRYTVFVVVVVVGGDAGCLSDYDHRVTPKGSNLMCRSMFRIDIEDLPTPP